MDKRLLKSLTTAKSRYELQIDEAQGRLKAVNEALASLLAHDSTPAPDSSTDQATLPDASKAEHPAFLKKKND